MGEGASGLITVTTPGGTAISETPIYYMSIIPTLNEWGFIILAFFMAGAVCLAIRRQRGASS